MRAPAVRAAWPHDCWAHAAETTTPEEYRRFVAAVGRLPNERALEIWMEEHDLVQRARSGAHFYLDSAFERLEERLGKERVRWSSRALDKLRELGQEIASAYE